MPISFGRWKVGFQSDLLLHKYRVKTAAVQPLVDWLFIYFDLMVSLLLRHFFPPLM
jgi:hypothetical protein